MTMNKKAGLPALVLLAVFGMAGCAQGAEQEQGQVQETQPEAGVLTVTEAEDGVFYAADVYNYPEAVSAADFNGIISGAEPAGVGLGTADNGTLEIGLQTPDGEDFTSDGDFLVVLTSTDKDSSAPLKYKSAVTFANGSATLKYSTMKTATVEPSESSYVVAFHTNGGTPSDFTQEVQSGGKATLPSPPMRQGYTFDGWYTSDYAVKWDFDTHTVTTNIDLYAKWLDSAITYRTITFHTNGGIPADFTQTAADGGKVTIPTAPTREGHTFDGWYTSNDYTMKWDFDTRTVTTDIDLYAKWLDNSITYRTVTFDLNYTGAPNPPDNQKIGEGGKATQPDAPVRTGWTFGGWFLDAAGTGAAWDFDLNTVKETITLYAKWTRNTYKVTFDTGDAEHTPAPLENVLYEDKITAPVITKTGYTLDGWYKDAAKTAKWDFGTDTVKEAMTLYGTWTLNSYTVTFYMNDGSGGVHATQTAAHNGTATLPNIPKRTDGYFFEGWFTQASGGTEYIFSSPVTADLPLYAKWTDEIKTSAIADEYLASKSANTADNPILLKMNLAIADNWNALVTTLASRTKYAALDLSACSMSGTAFDLYSGDVTGKNYIVSLILPDAATSIANSVYRTAAVNDSYSALRTVSGANITAIGEYVFRDCTSMTAASFPKATAIGKYAFEDCAALTTAPFPKATAIGEHAFEDCDALTAVSFPEITDIGDYAFNDCKALTSVDFPKAVTIGNNAFCYTPMTAVSFPEATTVKGSFGNCKSLTSVSLPKATNFEGMTFFGCTSLTSVSLPEATNIEGSTFYGCTALTAVSLPKATNIGDQTFDGCTALTTVSIPKVTSFGICVFQYSGTTPLTVTMGAAAPTVGSMMFYETDLAVTAAKNVTVRVPTGATGYDTAWQNAFSSGRTKGGTTSHANLVMQYY